MADQDVHASIRPSPDGHLAATYGGDEAETLDRDVIAVFLADSDGDPEFTLSLIDLFLEDAASQVGALRDAERLDDVVTLRRAAHSLKGSSMTMGATRLAALCLEIEGRLACEPVATITKDLMSKIDREVLQVHDALAAERQDILLGMTNKQR